MGHGGGIRSACLVVLAGLTLPAAGALGADNYKLSRLQLISGENPLPAGCGLKAPPPFKQSDFNPPDTGAEPHAAVNPHDPDNVVAAWTQDFGVTNLTASTRDGGRTWRRAIVAGNTNAGPARASERTNVRGRAKVKKTFPRTGRIAVRVKRRGFFSVKKRLRVRRPAR